MTLSLIKDQPISLSKEAPGLTKVLVGLGWDARTTAGEAFDLDTGALLLTGDYKVRSNDDFVFYGQKAMKTAEGRYVHPSGAIIHNGDNRTGAGDGDDETISVDLAKVPADIERIVFTVSIYDESQKFGMVRNSYIRLINEETGDVVARYDLGENVSQENAVNYAELYRHNGEWKFKAVEQGYTTGLGGIATDFGVVFG